MSDSKLDMILEELKALKPMQAILMDLKESMSVIKEEVKTLQFDVGKHDDRLAALERDMLTQKTISNSQQQQLRSLTVRLLNLPVVNGEKDDNYSGLRLRVYERILKPILSAAKTSKALATLPQMGSVIEACFRPFNASGASDSPPPVIIKLVSRPIKLALMKHRKELPKEEFPKIALVEDLTPDSHKAFVMLSKSSQTSKVWTHDGGIRFVLTGKATVHSVKSVYDPIQKILSSVSD